MTVDELGDVIERLRKLGAGSLPVVVPSDNSQSLLAITCCGTMEAWEDAKPRLSPGREFFGFGQHPPEDRKGPITHVVIIQ